VQTVQRSVHRSNRSVQTVQCSILRSNHSVKTVQRSVHRSSSFVQTVQRSVLCSNRSLQTVQHSIQSVLIVQSREGSLSCHTCCDTGPQFFWSQPKDRSNLSPLTTHEGVWRNYSNLDPHEWGWGKLSLWCMSLQKGYHILYLCKKVKRGWLSLLSYTCK
jgi:hypothetical protein